MVDFSKQIVIINSTIFIKVRRFTRYWIRMRSSTTGHEVSNSSVFVPFVVVHMPSEHYESSADMLLPLLKIFRKCFL